MKHINLEEREKMYALRLQNLSFREIANRLGRSHTTWSREWNRNSKFQEEYIPCKADKTANKRASKQRRRSRLKSPKIILYVRERLRQGWSPETIAGRLKIDHEGEKICQETIYRYIYASENRREHLETYLTRKQKRRKKLTGRKSAKHSRIKNAVNIDKRHHRVNNRSSVGHWETDLMESKRGIQTALQVNVERKYRYSILGKIQNKQSETNEIVMKKNFQNIPSQLLKTITSDNGGENACHKQIAVDLGIKWYFCNPYHSWEKGGVENMIGRIRRYLPKGTNLNKVSDKKIAELEYILNNTPRKCLNYKTPVEALIEAGYTPP